MKTNKTGAMVVENLVKHYGSTTAVKGLNFAIGAGEFFGLLGPNGAGKTTTLAMLAGLIKPTTGCIYLNGQPALSRNHRQKRMLGLVPQDFALYPSLTARDNLAFFGRLYGLRGVQLKARIDFGLAIARLENRADEPVLHFSGGMKRRLNIAIGLLHQPEILILDEPTVGVDAQSRHAILETLQQLNQAGMTLLYSTHYLEEAAQLCQRVAIMDQGNIIALDHPQTLIRNLAGGLIEMELARPLSQTDLENLTQTLGLHPVAGSPHRLRLETAHPETILPTLFHHLNLKGLTLHALEWKEPSLESVFLKLTGRQTRD